MKYNLMIISKIYQEIIWLGYVHCSSIQIKRQETTKYLLIIIRHKMFNKKIGTFLFNL